MEHDDQDLLPVTTFVPRRLVAAFQLMAAEWVAGGERSEKVVVDRVATDKRPDWTADELELAAHIGKKLAVESVARRALLYLADHAGVRLQGGKLAVELGLSNDPHDLAGMRKVAGCWGHVGRYCVQAGKELPFQWNAEDGYWVTAGTAEVLRRVLRAEPSSAAKSG